MSSAEKFSVKFEKNSETFWDVKRKKGRYFSNAIKCEWKELSIFYFPSLEILTSTHYHNLLQSIYWLHKCCLHFFWLSEISLRPGLTFVGMTWACGVGNEWVCWKREWVISVPFAERIVLRPDWEVIDFSLNIWKCSKLTWKKHDGTIRGDIGEAERLYVWLKTYIFGLLPLVFIIQKDIFALAAKPYRKCKCSLVMNRIRIITLSNWLYILIVCLDPRF